MYVLHIKHLSGIVTSVSSFLFFFILSRHNQYYICVHVCMDAKLCLQGNKKLSKSSLWYFNISNKVVVV